MRIAGRESTHPRRAVPTLPQARIPPDTKETHSKMPVPHALYSVPWRLSSNREKL